MALEKLTFGTRLGVGKFPFRKSSLFKKRNWLDVFRNYIVLPAKEKLKLQKSPSKSLQTMSLATSISVRCAARGGGAPSPCVRTAAWMTASTHAVGSCSLRSSPPMWPAATSSTSRRGSASAWTSRSSGTGSWLVPHLRWPSRLVVSKGHRRYAPRQPAHPAAHFQQGCGRSLRLWLVIFIHIVTLDAWK
jgi:hypothetical protein